MVLGVFGLGSLGIAALEDQDVIGQKEERWSMPGRSAVDISAGEAALSVGKDALLVSALATAGGAQKVTDPRTI